jgi:3-oxoacyl-[acyl-carrier-protein] synthase II
VLLVEAEGSAAHRGARALAHLVWWASWSGSSGLATAACPPPPPRAAVFCAREDGRVRGALAGSPWAEVPRHLAAPRAGDHEGAGGFAATAAVSAIAAGDVDGALVLGIAPERGHALLLVRGV